MAQVVELWPCTERHGRSSARLAPGQPGPTLAVANIWGVNQQVEDIPCSFYLSELKWFFFLVVIQVYYLANDCSLSQRFLKWAKDIEISHLKRMLSYLFGFLKFKGNFYNDMFSIILLRQFIQEPNNLPFLSVPRKVNCDYYVCVKIIPCL